MVAPARETHMADDASARITAGTEGRETLPL
jgi:hypothetical protein